MLHTQSKIVDYQSQSFSMARIFETASVTDVEPERAHDYHKIADELSEFLIVSPRKMLNNVSDHQPHLSEDSQILYQILDQEIEIQSPWDWDCSVPSQLIYDYKQQHFPPHQHTTLSHNAHQQLPKQYPNKKHEEILHQTQEQEQEQEAEYQISWDCNNPVLPQHFYVDKQQHFPSPSQQIPPSYNVHQQLSKQQQVAEQMTEFPQKHDLYHNILQEHVSSQDSIPQQHIPQQKTFQQPQHDEVDLLFDSVFGKSLETDLMINFEADATEMLFQYDTSLTELDHEEIAQYLDIPREEVEYFDAAEFLSSIETYISMETLASDSEKTPANSSFMPSYHVTFTNHCQHLTLVG